MTFRRSRAFAAALVTFAAFIDLVTYSVAVPVLPDLSSRLGATPTTIGLLFASFGSTVLLFAIPMGAISDRIGRRVPMVAGLVILAAASALFAFADRLWLLFAARMIQGSADAITWVVGFALVADLYGPAERGRVMGLVMAGTNAGLMIGPTIGGWLYEAGGVHLPFLTVAAAALTGAVLFAWIQPPAERSKREVVPVALVLRDRTVLACALVVAVASGTLAMFEPVLALWLSSSLQFGPSQVGLVFGIAAISSAVLHPLYGRFADRWGGARVAMVGLVWTAAVMPFLTLAWSFPSAASLYLLQAAALSMVVTPTLAYMAEAISRGGGDAFGIAYGVYNVAWGAGLLAGPAFGGVLYERIGFDGLMLAWAPLVAVTTIALAGAARPSGPSY
jgi:multidrug resistance protein